MQINIQTIHQDSRIASIVSIENEDKLFSPSCVFTYPLMKIYQRFAGFLFDFQDRKAVSRAIHQGRGAKGTVVPKQLPCLPAQPTGSPCSAQQQLQAMGVFGSTEGSSTRTLAEHPDPLPYICEQLLTPSLAITKKISIDFIRSLVLLSK